MNDKQTDPNAKIQGDQKLDFMMRLILIVAGVALIASGVVLAFRNGNGVSTAAILTAGFALAFMAYVGRYLTRIRFRDFEATLDRVQARLNEVGTKATEAAQDLENLASRYQSVMTSMSSGAERDAELETLLFESEEEARTGRITPDIIKELAQKSDKLSRIRMLGYMKGDPKLRDTEIIFHVIANPYAGFDQDRFLLLAGEMLHTLDEAQRRKLKEIIVQQQTDGEIKQTRIRWLTAERLLRLMAR